VEFVWQTAPDGFTGDAHVTGVKVFKMHMGVADATGRQTPLPIEGSGYTIDADLVVKALGFDPEEIPTLFGAPELKVSRWGTVQVKYGTMMTNLDGVFAAGDIVRGASLVVWGIKDGRDAAEGIHKFIQAKAAQPVAVAAE
jgi:glutamate synthase (NADPH/NADH) small chain